jgi:hypothetical protein
MQHLLVQHSVEREPEVFAWLAFLAIQLADHPAQRVHLELHRAGDAAQFDVASLLQACPPHPDAGQRKIRIVGNIRLGGRRDIADDVGELFAVGIHP